MRYFLFLIFLFSCVNSINKKGYLVYDNDVENIKIGISSKNDIINTIGKPTINIDQDKWLYYSYKSKKILFFKPKIFERKVLLIEFDNSIVQKVQYKKLKDKKISFKKDIIELNKSKESLFRDLFNNIGTVTPGGI